MRFYFIFPLAACLGISCKNSSETISPAASVAVPAVYSKIYGATSITNDGTYITIKTTGVPDHKSAYFSGTNALYEAFTGKTFGGNNFAKNPNSISTQSYTFKIPLNPQMDPAHKATPLGPIGVALNGVPLFNQYAGPSQPLTNEINSFDQYWGHPQQTGSYHYHVEPLYLTQVKASKSALLGFLLDGFPVYGPEENGQTVQNSSLDAYHGHSHSTTEFPNGIYHYHITSTDPYINGSGFYGSAGTVSQ
ncbi:YHYH protein [Aquirufa rosea]|uniref:YHYH protein n=1 Tax=Aquirufa rosea TaxID=2509241 RepID=A0A4Q1C020_9BACT|nr:YHYH protein [Aquirufa rosea]RXK49731.1 YHYH protein [Aquirufa rosea]